MGNKGSSSTAGHAVAFAAGAATALMLSNLVKKTHSKPPAPALAAGDLDALPIDDAAAEPVLDEALLERLQQEEKFEEFEAVLRGFSARHEAWEAKRLGKPDDECSVLSKTAEGWQRVQMLLAQGTEATKVEATQLIAQLELQEKRRDEAEAKRRGVSYKEYLYEQFCKEEKKQEEKQRREAEAKGIDFDRKKETDMEELMKLLQTGSDAGGGKEDSGTIVWTHEHMRVDLLPRTLFLVQMCALSHADDDDKLPAWVTGAKPECTFWVRSPDVPLSLCLEAEDVATKRAWLEGLRLEAARVGTGAVTHAHKGLAWWLYRVGSKLREMGNDPSVEWMESEGNAWFAHLDRLDDRLMVGSMLNAALLSLRFDASKKDRLTYAVTEIVHNLLLPRLASSANEADEDKKDEWKQLGRRIDRVAEAQRVGLSAHPLVLLGTMLNRLAQFQRLTRIDLVKSQSLFDDMDKVAADSFGPVVGEGEQKQRMGALFKQAVLAICVDKNDTGTNKAKVKVNPDKKQAFAQACASRAAEISRMQQAVLAPLVKGAWFQAHWPNSPVQRIFVVLQRDLPLFVAEKEYGASTLADMDLPSYATDRLAGALVWRAEGQELPSWETRVRAPLGEYYYERVPQDEQNRICLCRCSSWIDDA